MQVQALRDPAALTVFLLAAAMLQEAHAARGEIGSETPQSGSKEHSQ